MRRRGRRPTTWACRSSAAVPLADRGQGRDRGGARTSEPGGARPRATAARRGETAATPEGAPTTSTPKPSNAKQAEQAEAREPEEPRWIAELDAADRRRATRLIARLRRARRPRRGGSPARTSPAACRPSPSAQSRTGSRSSRRRRPGHLKHATKAPRRRSARAGRRPRRPLATRRRRRPHRSGSRRSDVAAARKRRRMPRAVGCHGNEAGIRTMTAVTSASATSGLLSDDEVRRIDAYWRAANYLSVGQIYLLDNPLLREPLQPEHVKPRLLGHWGTTPGLNFIYAHMNRVIRERDLDAIYVTGPRARRARPRRERLPRGDLHRDLPARSAATRRAAPAVPAVLVPGRDPEPRRARDARARSTRAASSATRSRTPTAPRSTTPTCSSAASSATARPRPARWRRAGTPNKFLEPGDGRRRPADPPPERLQDRQPDRARPDSRGRSSSRCSRATAIAPHPRRGRRPGGQCTRLMAAALDDALDEIRAIQRRAREDGRPARAAVADDRPAHAEGLDRPQGGRRRPGRGHVALAPGARSPTSGRTPEHRAHPRGLAPELPARGAVRRATASLVPSSPSCRRRATGG